MEKRSLVRRQRIQDPLDKSLLQNIFKVLEDFKQGVKCMWPMVLPQALCIIWRCFFMVGLAVLPTAGHSLFAGLALQVRAGFSSFRPSFCMCWRVLFYSALVHALHNLLLFLSKEEEDQRCFFCFCLLNYFSAILCIKQCWA